MAINKLKKPLVLVILDGFGHSENKYKNAIFSAKKPNFDKFMQVYPNAFIKASGHAVGLLPGFVGNSEVGHFTIGCGRIIKQPLIIINEAIKSGDFFKNRVLLEVFDTLKASNKLSYDSQKKDFVAGQPALHIMGLLSDAGVHSHIDHLFAYLKAAKENGFEKVYIHAFLDGRDVAPKTAGIYLQELENFININKIGVIASLHGRFYAMDRDENFDRTKKTYDVLVGNTLDKSFGQDIKGLGWHELLENSYKNGVMDEFFEPVRLVDATGEIKDGDSVIFFNFRPDRARQLTSLFLSKNLDSKNKDRGPKILDFVTPVQYSKDLDTRVMFEIAPVKNTLKQILAQNNKTIFSIAETEKYAHVTYFFDGLNENKLDCDTWVLVKSKVLPTYENCPCMQAEKITDIVIESTKNDLRDFYLINYANADMVGHSGNFEATVKAIECLDLQLKRLYDVFIKELDGIMLVTADHGKAEIMFDQKTGQPNTAHTTSLVPFIFIKNGLECESKILLPVSQLSEIAPFILKNMGIKVPKDMLKS